MDGRIIHIEGLDIDGSGGGEGDGIGIGAPSAIVQLENDRITGLIGHLSSSHADVSVIAAPNPPIRWNRRPSLTRTTSDP